MKKISSMLALGMAFALTFGMTVSAAESPATQNPDFQPTTSQVETAEKTIEELTPVSAVTSTTTLVDDKGNTVAPTVKPIEVQTVAELQSTDVADKAVESLKTSGGEAKVTETIAKAMEAVKIPVEEGKKVDAASVKIDKNPIAAAVIEIPANTVIPETGIQLEISLPGFAPEAGKTYVVMHLGKDGWEIIAPDAITDGKVTATFKDLSPVTVNEVTFTVVSVTPPEDLKPVGEEEEEEDSEDDSNTASVQAAVNPATSPKTAETLPAAGVMALIALAGAAVCAGRMRCNK